MKTGSGKLTLISRQDPRGETRPPLAHGALRRRERGGEEGTEQKANLHLFASRLCGDTEMARRLDTATTARGEKRAHLGGRKEITISSFPHAPCMLVRNVLMTGRDPTFRGQLQGFSQHGARVDSQRKL